jgi:hypothetical protein
MLLFNVTPLDFNEPVPAFHKFLIPSEKEVFLFASLTNFAPHKFLERIVTGDEIWVHRYEPENKARSMASKRPTSPVAKKFKSQPSASKIMLTLFWDMQGAILVHFTPKGENFNTADFHMFDLMKEALRRKPSSDEDVIGEVQNLLQTQSKNFF